jgi:hypothetical protein
VTIEKICAHTGSNLKVENDSVDVAGIKLIVDAVAAVSEILKSNLKKSAYMLKYFA